MGVHDGQVDRVVAAGLRLERGRPEAARTQCRGEAGNGSEKKEYGQKIAVAGHCCDKVMKLFIHIASYASVHKQVQILST